VICVVIVLVWLSTLEDFYVLVFVNEQDNSISCTVDGFGPWKKFSGQISQSDIYR